MTDLQRTDGTTVKMADVAEKVATADSADAIRDALETVLPTELPKIYFGEKPGEGFFGNHDGEQFWNRAALRTFQYHWNTAAQRRGLSKADFYAETGRRVTKNKFGQTVCKDVEKLANAIRSPFSQSRKMIETSIGELTDALESADWTDEEKAKMENRLDQLTDQLQRYEKKPLAGVPRGSKGGTDPRRKADALIDLLNL